MNRLLLTLVALCLAGPALADDAALSRCRSVADALARLACYDAIVVKGAPVPKAAPTERFGLEAQLAMAASPHEQLESRIPGKFEGWESRTEFRLANDQVWAINDGSRAYYQLVDPKVTITRGVLGSFFMKIEGVAQSPKVKRLR